MPQKAFPIELFRAVKCTLTDDVNDKKPRTQKQKLCTLFFSVFSWNYCVQYVLKSNSEKTHCILIC